MFLAAIEQPEAERAAFLADACGDDALLRHEVESLLASDAAAGSFCETPAAGLLYPAGNRPPPRLAPGARLASYEIDALVGAGGMGEVYRARDTRLGRTVAIKTIGAQVAEPSARRALLREARHASSLDHPNICTIYEVGEAGGLPFIAMAFVDGRPLDELLRAGSLDLRKRLAYGIQVAAAVGHAHARGIVHRDLKSSNVVVTENGQAVVLDFGLARRFAAAGGASFDATVTGLHALAGTLTHMAPEVLLGRPADARGDVWALGVLLHELATGRLPFSGQTPFETSSAIINEPLPPLPRAVPLPVRVVIQRCLEKDPSARYACGAVVAAALESAVARRWWSLPALLRVHQARARRVAAALLVAGSAVLFGGDRFTPATQSGPGPAIGTVALLPLENASGDAADAVYAEGITDALVSGLGGLDGVRVIARASTGRYEGTTKPPATIARELGADAVVQGSLRRSGDRIAIQVALYDARAGRALWSDSYERTAREVLVLEADIVQGLAARVRASLRPWARERLTMARAVDPEVYEGYLKGRYYWNQRTEASLRQAAALLEQAIGLDPTYAPAYVLLADCYNLLGTVMVGAGSPREFRTRAAAQVLQALQIDPFSAEAHATLGYVRHYDWEWAEAEREFRRAIELNPNYPLARIWYANMLMSQRRHDEALAQVQAALDLDPFSIVVNTNLAWVLERAGRLDEAIAHLQKTRQMGPEYTQARLRLALALMAAGRVGEAREQAEWLVQHTSRAPYALRLLAAAHARAGRRAAAMAVIDEMREMAARRYVPPNVLGEAYAELGELDAALPWFERALEERVNSVVYMDPAGPVVAAMRAHPRLGPLLAQVGLF
jgi:eukaryotic-like serine/threonine-protein kinase